MIVFKKALGETFILQTILVIENRHSRWSNRLSNLKKYKQFTELPQSLLTNNGNKNYCVELTMHTLLNDRLLYTSFLVWGEGRMRGKGGRRDKGFQYANCKHNQKF